MKHVGYGQGYRYVHSDPDAKDEMACLPESLHGQKYFKEDELREFSIYHFSFISFHFENSTSPLAMEYDK